MSEKDLSLRLVASGGRFADMGVSQIPEEEIEECEYALAPRADDPSVRRVEGTREEPCFMCGDMLLVHPRDPQRAAKVCPGCLPDLLGRQVQ